MRHQTPALLSAIVAVVALAAPALAAPSGGARVAHVKDAPPVDPGTCHARLNSGRNRCTILPSHCTHGFVAIAHPPACACECQPGPRRPPKGHR
jgi:hypothetical protein